MPSSDRSRSAYITYTETHLSDDEILAMFREMATWLAGQQVRDKEHEHYGAVWFPTETRYDNRDTACAALAFWRLFQLTSEDGFADQAKLARDYALRVQEEDGGYAELTRGNQRIDEGSIVNTGLIADSLIRAYRAGLPFEQRDLDALTRMADFELTLEWVPGGFYHDENHAYKKTRMDCQNTTALAGMSLAHIWRFLREQGAEAKDAWIEAAERTVPRVVEGQDPTGQWPYRMGQIDQYPCDMNHQGMLMLLAGELHRHFGGDDLLQALVRGGEWLVEDALLHTEHGTKHNWTFQKSACLYFSWGYFMTGAALAQLATLDLERAETWKHEARELLRYVRTDLWGNRNCEREGPFKLTEAGMAPGYAWHGQSMGWCTYEMDHILRDMGIAFG